MTKPINLLKNKNWILEQIKSGRRSSEIASDLNIGRSIVNRQISKVKKSLTIDEIIDLTLNSKDSRQLFSHKSEPYKKIIELTLFLTNNPQFRERIWYLANNTTESPKCKGCGKSVKWDYSDQKFRTYCSVNCSWDNDKEFLIEKRLKTNHKKFGCDYHNQSHIDKNALDLLSNKNWLKHQHYELKKPLTKIAKELKVNWMLPNTYIQHHELNGKHYYASESTKEIINFLNEEFGFDLKINDRTLIKPKEIDILIPSKKVGIEFNGLFWHSDLLFSKKKINSKLYHLNKTKKCNDNGVRLIHIFENEWYYQEEIVKSRLRIILNSDKIKRIYARKCVIQEIIKKESSIFLNKTHIQGNYNSKINLGLFYNNKLVSVMTFGKSRFNKKIEYELIRFSSDLNTIVIGGANKLFSYFVKTYNPKSIISYSDKKWNTGNVYNKLGFNYSYSSNPNYWYFKKNELILHSRIKFQKHKLENILFTFNSQLTEWENMKNNGYNRIWDCGNDVFIWSNYCPN